MLSSTIADNHRLETVFKGFIIVFHGNRHTPFSKIRKVLDFHNMIFYHEEYRYNLASSCVEGPHCDPNKKKM